MGRPAAQLAPVALGGSAPSRLLSDQAVHDHLMKECPWYAKVIGGEGAANPGDHCGDTSKGTVVAQQRTSGGALLKFTPRTPEASTVVKPTVPPGGPGLFHHKGLHLPPYIEHLWFHLVKRYGKHEAYRVAVGVVKKWAAGVNPGGWKTKSGKGKRTHPDVRAAAARNVAEWEKDKAIGHEGHGGGGHEVKATLALAANAANPWGKPFERTILGQGSTVRTGVVTAPGAKPTGLQPQLRANAQLRHVPSQTVAAGPPLPPGVSLPTPEECEKLADQVAADAPGYDRPVLTGAVKHLRDAAQKLRKNEYVHALSSLRSAQTGILAAHTELRTNSIPAANVFSVAVGIPPAATSSARSEMAQSVAERDKFKQHYLAVSRLIDRIRRFHFHGMYGGLAEARF
jgi:hypothetical protein